MVPTGFAMLAIVPLAFVVRGVARDERLRDVRPWVAVLAASYATPLVLWAALPGRERSLSRDMDPAFVPVITIAALAVLAALAVAHRRAGTDGADLGVLMDLLNRQLAGQDQ